MSMQPYIVIAKFANCVLFIVKFEKVIKYILLSKTL